MRTRLLAVLFVASAAAAPGGCSSGSSAMPDGTGPADVMCNQCGDVEGADETAVGDVMCNQCGDIEPDDGLVPDLVPDVPTDTAGDVPPDLLPDVPPDVEPDVAEDVPSDVPEPECEDADDCVAAFGAPLLCMEWDCHQGICEQVPADLGLPCDDLEVCTLDDVCDGEGFCNGTWDACDDADVCTVDSCDMGVGCSYSPEGPKACVDDDGKAGFSACKDNAWLPCKAVGPCELAVNTNDTGTVNPFIFPAREGNFYVSYVASEDGGGNLKLAWVDPITCSTVQGPFTVNDVPGGVYYWGNQWALSDGTGNFYAVWEAKSGLGDIKFSTSESGLEFSPSVEVVSTSDNGVYPSMAILSPGKPVIAWTGYIGAPNPKGFSYDAFVSTNPNVFGGGMFAPGIQVAATEIQDDSTAVAVDAKGTIYVAWESFQDGTDEGGNVYVAKSTDGGLTFSPKVRVNDVPGKANVGISTFIAWGGDRLYVVWSDTRTDPEGDVYIDSAPDGAAFGQDVKVNDDGYRYQEDPSVVVADGTNCPGTVYVVWQDMRSNKSYDIYGTRSTDKGNTFEANKVVHQSTDGDQMNPAIGVDYNCVVGVAWRDDTGNEKFNVKAALLPSW